MRKTVNNQKGFILPLVLVVIALLTAGVGYLLTQSVAELKANALNQDYELCILTAKNAMAIAQAELENDINYSGTGGLLDDENGGCYRITMTAAAENLRVIDIESRYGDYIKNFTGEIAIMLQNDETNRGVISSFKWKMLGAV